MNLLDKTAHGVVYGADPGFDKDDWIENGMKGLCPDCGYGSDDHAETMGTCIENVPGEDDAALDEQASAEIDTAVIDTAIELESQAKPHAAMQKAIAKLQAIVKQDPDPDDPMGIYKHGLAQKLLNNNLHKLKTYKIGDK